MSYRLIDSNAIAIKYPEVNNMPCVYADLPDGLNGKFIYVQPEPPWAPCKETLPDEGLECWITSKDGAVYHGMFTRRYGERRDSGFILNGFGFARLNTIAAWKPYAIPEPWEGENVERICKN